MDEFQFGPSGRRSRLGEPRTRQARNRSRGRLLLVLIAGLVVAAVLAFVAVTGTEHASDDPSSVSSADRARDAAARGTIGRAVVVAQTLYAERGSFPSDVATLSAVDPTLTFTTEPSAEPSTVSYAVGGRGFAAAVRSESGTCWWVRVDLSGATSYGTGSSCTGEAAMAASDAAW